MAAAWQAGQECVGLGAILWVPRRASDQKNDLLRRDHLDRQVASQTDVRPVADASAVRVVARWGAGRCQARCREVGHGYQWASGGKELLRAQVRQERPQQDAPPKVVRRAAWAARPGALRSGRCALLWVVLREQKAGLLALALERRQAQEQRQALAALPRADQALLRVPLVRRLGGQQARRELA